MLQPRPIELLVSTAMRTSTDLETSSHVSKIKAICNKKTSKIWSETLVVSTFFLKLIVENRFVNAIAA